jgi:hypothetical protein
MYAHLYSLKLTNEFNLKFMLKFCLLGERKLSIIFKQIICQIMKSKTQICPV